MNKENMKTVSRYGIFLLAMTLSLFVFGVENGYSNPISTETNDLYSEEDGTAFTVSDAGQAQQPEANPKEKKNDGLISSMMGHGQGGHSWMWVGMMLVLLVIMMA